MPMAFCFSHLISSYLTFLPLPSPTPFSLPPFRSNPCKLKAAVFSSHLCYIHPFHREMPIQEMSPKSPPQRKTNQRAESNSLLNPQKTRLRILGLSSVLWFTRGQDGHSAPFRFVSPTPLNLHENPGVSRDDGQVC